MLSDTNIELVTMAGLAVILILSGPWLVRQGVMTICTVANNGDARSCLINQTTIDALHKACEQRGVIYTVMQDVHCTLMLCRHAK